MQITALTLCKISVLILLHRIFSAIAWFKRFCWAMGIFITLYMLAALFAAAFICFPASQLWNPEVQGTCGNQVLLDRIIPVPWVLTDFGILIAPLFVIRKLQLSRSGMVRVYAAFLIGAATCIVSTIRYRTTFFKLVDFSCKFSKTQNLFSQNHHANHQNREHDPHNNLEHNRSPCHHRLPLPHAFGTRHSLVHRPLPTHAKVYTNRDSPILREATGVLVKQVFGGAVASHRGENTKQFNSERVKSAKCANRAA